MKNKDTSISKKLTLVYLQQLFLEETDQNHYITMADIHSFLESKGVFVDRRTVYSAIAILDAIGFEIVGLRDKGNYKYHHPTRQFDNNELKFLIDSVAASKFLTESKAKELIEKIKSLGSKYSRQSLNRNILVGNRIKSMNDKVLKNLDTIYTSINSNSKITFYYMKWTPERKLVYVREKQQYSVSPFAVALCDNNYYLIAYDDKYQNIRHYRIDKMRTINVSSDLREGIEQYKRFNLSDYMLKTFGMFSGKEETVTLECSNSLAGVFIDRFGDNIAIRPNYENSETCIIRVTVHISPQFFGWIFALGESVKILSPESARNDFTAMIESVLNRYRN